MSGMNKRVEFPGPGESVQIVSKPIPEAPPKGLVVKNHYSGICHSDVHLWMDKWRMSDDLTVSLSSFIKGFSFPAVFGHEISGEVYSLGSEYKGDLVVGDKVAVHTWCGCEECGPCKAKDHLMCPKFSDHNIGVGKEGGFQQYTPVEHGHYAVKVPEGMPMDVASILTCSGITAYHGVSKIVSSVERACKNYGSASALLIGAGGVGHWGIQWAKAMLPSNAKVFIADISEDKVQGGVKHGADEGILWDLATSEEDLVNRTKDQTGGGIDGSVDFVGLPSTTGKALQAAKKGATCAMIGLAGGTLKASTLATIFGMVKVEGVLVGTLDQLKDMFDLYKAKEVKATPMTLVTPEDTERCIRELEAGTFQGRYVIDWTQTQQ